MKKIVFILHTLALSSCALFDNTPPMMGTVTDGVYAQPQGYFSCPLNAEFLGLDELARITDARRIVKTKDIPLSQRAPSDWKRTKVVSNEIHASGVVKIKSASGTVIEISSGGYTHSAESVLHSGLSGGFSWRFATREIPRVTGRMVTGLLLVPWHDEQNSYMGQNLLAGYMQGQGPDAQLWIKSNIVIEELIHTVIIRLPISTYLTEHVHVRDLHAVREDIASRPELQEKLFTHATEWLAQCEFAEEMK